MRDGVESQTAATGQSFPVTSLPVPAPTPRCCAFWPRRTSPARSACTGSTITLLEQHADPARQADAAVLRIKGTDKAIAVAIDGNGRYCYLEPRRGGAIAVAEVTRNLACVGAKPLAITDCLNFGNPEKPEIYYQPARGSRRYGRCLSKTERAGGRRQRESVQ